MHDLTIVIMTHNRPRLLIEAVASVLSQEYNFFYFIVSDNSDNTETYDALNRQKLLKSLEYKRRNNIPAIEHFNLILDETKTKYLVIFHDDDIMLPKMVGELYKAISSDSSIIAVSCNGKNIADKKIIGNAMRLNRNIILTNPKNYLLNFFREYNIAPLSAYMYNIEIIKKNGLRFSNYAGKYSDIIWTIELIKLGNIKWLAEHLMLYNIHSGQDSQIFSYYSQQLLMNYLKNTASDKTLRRLLNKYRIMIFYTIMRRRLFKNNKMSLFLHKQMYILFYSQIRYFILFCRNIAGLYIRKFIR